MKVTWNKPANENGEITKYTVVYSYNFEGKDIRVSHSTNDKTFTYSFDVLGGIRYTVSVGAETIQPGPKATNLEEVPVYSKLWNLVSGSSRHSKWPGTEKTLEQLQK